MKQIVAILLTMTLTACYDLEAKFDITTGKAELSQSMSQEFHEMTEANLKDNCTGENETYSVTDELITCSKIGEFDVNDWIEEGTINVAGGPRGQDSALDMGLTVEDVGWGKILVKLDVAYMIEQSPRDDDNEPPADMLPMLKAGMAGHGFKFTFKGKRIIESNGSVSDDKTTVTFFVPLNDLLDPENRTAPDLYSAEIKY